MFKFATALYKEAIILINDKTGLLFMFLLPLILVTVVTLVQNSAFELANKNRISMLAVNADRGEEGEKLLQLLEKSGMFRMIKSENGRPETMAGSLKSENALTGIYIPENFSRDLEYRSLTVSSRVLADFGLSDNEPEKSGNVPEIKLYFDPVLQKNFRTTIENILNAYLYELENSMMISLLYNEAGIQGKNEEVSRMIKENRTVIKEEIAVKDHERVAENATQHNVPAWTIFAIFFMVISLGGNMVKEKVNGSYVRLRTMPTSILLIISAKMLLYLIIAVLQVAIIFTFSAWIFPLLQLPPLEMPGNFAAFTTVVLITGLAAVSYSVLIGAFSKSQVQANSFGAISVIIFAAIGGIWVPVFLMPDYLQKISWFSPLRQSLDGFYVLFLENGNRADLIEPMTVLFAFMLICLSAAFVKFKADKLI